MGFWSSSDTQAHSGDSAKHVSQAEHDSRNDAEKAGLFERGDDEKNSQPFSRTDNSGHQAESFWKSIF